MNQVSQSINQASGSMKTFGASIFNNTQGPLKNFNTNLQAVPKSMNAVNTATTTTTSKLQRFGEAFKGNRGIVFGIAGLTSALGEAIGMMGMYGDTAQRLGEAQQKLNNLQEKGITAGKAYADAQNEVVKQQRFFNMVQRNTVLSNMDMIFFTTMAVSGFIKLGTGANKTGSIMNKLKGIFVAAKGATAQYSGALASMNAVSASGVGPINALSGAIKGLGINIRGLLMATAIGAIVVGIGLLIQKFMEASSESQKAQDAIAASTKQSAADFEAMSAVTKRSAGQTLDSIKGLSEEGQSAMEAYALAVGKAMTATGKSLDQIQIQNLRHQAEHKRWLAGIVADQIKAIEAINIAAIRSPNAVQIAAAKNTPQLKELHQQITDLTNGAKDLEGQAQTLEDQLNGVATASKTLKITSEQSTASMAKVQASMYQADLLVLDFVNGLQTLGQTFTKEQIQKAAEETAVGMGLMIDKMGNRVFTDQQIADFLERVGFHLGNIPDPAKKAKDAMKELGDAIVIMNGAVSGLSTQDLLTSFIMHFNDNLTQSQNVMTGAAQKLDLVKTKFGDQLAAAEAAGVGTQFVTAKMQELGATDIEVAIGVTKYNNERNAQEKIDKKAAKAAAELTETEQAHADMEKTIADRLAERKTRTDEVVAALYGHVNVAGMDLETMEGVQKVYEDTTGQIHAQADALKFNEIFWKKITPAEIEATQAEMQHAFELANTNDMISQNVEWQYKRIKAQLEGAQAAKADSEALRLTAISSDQYRATYEKLNAEVLRGAPIAKMSIQQLQDWAKAFDGSKESALAFWNESQDLIEGSRGLSGGILKDLFDDTSMKEFNKAWKELDLSVVPRKLKDNFKDVAKELRPVYEAGRDASTGLELVSMALHGTGKAVSDSQIHKLMDNVFEELEKFSQIDLEASQLFELPNFVDDLKNHTEDFVLTQLALTDAMRDGNITQEEAIDIMKLYKFEGGDMTDMTDKQREALAAMGIVVDENGNVIEDATAKTDEATTAIENMTIAATETTTIQKMHGEMVQNIMKMNLIMATNWSQTMETMWGLTDIFANDDNGIVDIFTVDIPTAVQASIDALKEMGIALVAIMSIMSGKGGKGGKGGFQNVGAFGDLNAGGGGGLAEILKGQDLIGNRSNFGNQSGGGWPGSTDFEIKKQSGGDQKGGGGGLLAQWATMLQGMVQLTLTTKQVIEGAFSQMVTIVGKHFSNLSIHWNSMALNMAKAASGSANIIAKNFASGVTQTGKHFSNLSKHWNSMALNIAKAASSSANKMAANYASGVTQSGKHFSNLSKHFNSMALNIAKAASSSANKMAANFASGVKQSTSAFSKLASHWSKVCNSIINNAKSAASGANKALASIKDRTVTIKYVKQGSPTAKGGLFPMEEGGLISAAGGMNISNGPTRSGPFLYGDNSGGREIQAFIPLDGHKADRIMDALDSVTGRRRNAGVMIAGGERTITVPITININGEQYSFTKKYRLRQDRDIAQQVF